MIDYRPWGFYAITLAVALVLQIFELPYGLAVLRPFWVPLVLVYWAMVIPEPSGLIPAFIAGLLLDVLLGSVLGQHALGLTLMVFVTLLLRGWFTLFPVWQEAAALMLVWGLYAFLMFWIDGATAHRADPWLNWTPVLTTSLVWPAAVSVLNALRRRSQHDPLRL